MMKKSPILLVIFSVILILFLKFTSNERLSVNSESNAKSKNYSASHKGVKLATKTTRSLHEFESLLSPYLNQPMSLEDFLKVKSLAIKWGEADPEAAISFFLQTKNEDDLESLMFEVFYGIGKKDVFAAFRLAESVYPQEDSRHGDLKASALRSYAEQGKFDELPRLFATVTNEEEKDNLLGAIIDKWSGFDPLSVAAVLADMPQSSSRTIKYGRLALIWSKIDPSSAAEFANKLPAGDERKHAVQNTISSWIAKDIDAVSSWLDQFYGDPDIDFAVAKFTTSVDIELYEPSAIVSWAESIEDSALRSESLNSVLKSWAVSDPYAALDWIKNKSGKNQTDLALSEIAITLSSDDRSVAIDAVKFVSDNVLRINTLSKIYNDWYTQEPNKAIINLNENTTLSTADRDKIHTSFSEGKL